MRAVVRLVAIGLNGSNLVQRLIDIGRHIGHAILAGARELAHLATEDNDREKDNRHTNQHQPGEFQRSHRQHHQGTQHQQQIPQCKRSRRAHHHFEQRGVIGQPRNNFTRAGQFKKSWREI